MESDAGVGAKAPTLLPKGSYECPKCGNMIEVFIRLTCPPECVKHSGGSVPMSRRKK